MFEHAYILVCKHVQTQTMTQHVHILESKELICSFESTSTDTVYRPLKRKRKDFLLGET